MSSSFGEEIAFENLPNFRPAGAHDHLINKNGLRIKRLLYRSSKTDQITPKDKGLLLKLGIKSIIDIRGEQSYNRLPFKPLDDLYTPCVIRDNQKCDLIPHSQSAVGRRYLFDVYTHELGEYVLKQANIFLRMLIIVLMMIDKLLGTHLAAKILGPFVIGKHSLLSYYVEFLELSKPVIVQMIKLLLSPEENLPMLIHCEYGKDRTGILTALILSSLELDDELIVHDYAKSEGGLVPVREQLYEELVQCMAMPEEFCLAKPDTMRGVLHELRRRYGNISEYLKSIGFSIEDQRKLRSIFFTNEE